MKARTFVGMFTAIGLLTGSAFGATIHVPADQPTIQAGIDAASAGDIVVVAEGTYTENVTFLGKAITVRADAGAGAVVIDGNQAGSVVTFATAESSESVLDGFTIRNGSGTGEVDEPT